MRKRTISQFISLAVLHSSWGPEVKWLCNPVLSCHSCVLSWFACPIGVLVQYSGYHAFPFFAVGTILLIGVLFGRLLCGWVCPFGFLQDGLHRLPTRKFLLPEWTSNVKYLVLILMVFSVPFFLGETTNYSFCRFCPAAALQVTIPGIAQTGWQLSYGQIVKLGVLVAILGLVVFSSRAFCRTLCPIGALMAPLNYVSYWIVKTPLGECVSCKNCDKVCITDVKPSERISRSISPNRALDCVVCHDCQTPCKVGRTGE